LIDYHNFCIVRFLYSHFYFPFSLVYLFIIYFPIVYSYNLRLGCVQNWSVTWISVKLKKCNVVSFVEINQSFFSWEWLFVMLVKCKYIGDCLMIICYFTL
jgi:hypothetical protein